MEVPYGLPYPVFVPWRASIPISRAASSMLVEKLPDTLQASHQRPPGMPALDSGSAPRMSKASMTVPTISSRSVFRIRYQAEAERAKDACELAAIRQLARLAPRSIRLE